MQFESIVKGKSNKELLEMIEHPDKYQPEIIKAAKKEIKERGGLAKLQEMLGEKKESKALLDPAKREGDLVKIKCSNCGYESEPKKWGVRIFLGVLYLLLGVVSGLIFFSSTNPYVCKSCGRREFLTKVRNNGVEIPLGGSSKVKFVFISTILGLFLLGAAFYGATDRAAIEKGNEAYELSESGAFLTSAEMSEEAAEEAILPENKIELYKNAGLMYATEEKTDKALENFNKAINLVEKDSFNYFLIQGEILLLEENPALALENYLKAYEMAPGDYQINNSLGLFYLDLDDKYPSFVDLDKAVDYLEAAVELNSSSLSLTNLGLAYLLTDDYDNALDVLLQADSEDAYRYFYISMAYSANGDSTKAGEYLGKAFALDPELMEFMEEYLGEDFVLY